MRTLRYGLTALVALSPLPASAQVAAQDPDIVVQGERGEKLSGWRVAETDHVVVYSDGSQSELVRITHNLERLHFLLSMLLNRHGKPDDTIKLRVTLVGDGAEFEAMDLRNVRSAQGPFAPAFQLQRYYDPRDDGAVMATSRQDGTAAIEPGRIMDLQGIGGSQLNPQTGQVESSLFSPGTMGTSFTSSGNTVPITAESRLYAGFAQHFLLTYFPAAYPRWYLDGFGELFSTIRVADEGTIEYGHMPQGYRRVMEAFRQVPIKDVITGKYLAEATTQRRWTPFHAWILTHYLFFSEERRPQFSKYLSAIGRGATLEQASEVFGNLDKLGAEVLAYDNKRLPYERMTYPPELAGEPVVQQLTQSQAAFLKGRIELGSRVEIPAAPTEARARAIAARNKWLGRLRQDARRYPRNVEAQLLLAEAECRTGNHAECLGAAEAALRMLPADARALAWKGLAQAQLAVTGPVSERPAQLRAARGTIIRANLADTESTLPLLGYYLSYSTAGETPPKIAVVGLLKAVDSVPAAPAPRLLLGAELARQGQSEAARRILEPVAHGPYDSPERIPAQAILDALPSR